MLWEVGSEGEERRWKKTPFVWITYRHRASFARSFHGVARYQYFVSLTAHTCQWRRGRVFNVDLSLFDRLVYLAIFCASNVRRSTFTVTAVCAHAQRPDLGFVDVLVGRKSTLR